MSTSTVIQPGVVILLSGYRRHGKDTFYRHIAGEQADYVYNVSREGKLFYFPVANYKRVAFADVLKRDCAEFLGLTLDEIEAMKDHPLPVPYAFKCTTPVNNPPTVRDVLIDHGAYCRALDPDYFVARVRDQLSPDHVTVVTDFRYSNEYDYWIRHGVQVVTARIHRKDEPVPDASIESEHQLDNFNFEIQIECL